MVATRKVARARVATLLTAGLLAVGLSALTPAYAALLDAPTGLSASTGDAVPVLSWNRMPGATSYHVEVSSDGTFATNQVDASTTNVHYVPTIQLPPGALSWRVQATYGSTGASDWTTSSVDRPVVPVPVQQAPHGAVAFPADPLVYHWGPVTGAMGYDVQVSDDPNFARDVTTTPTTGSSLVPTTVQQAGTYWWRVRTKLANGVVSDYSSGMSYDVTTSAASGTDPESPSPSKDTTQVTDVVLDWPAVPGAVSYTLQVSTDREFLDSAAQVALVTGITGSRYSPPTTWDNDQYFWRVRGVDVSGNAFGWSTTWAFQRSWKEQPKPTYPTGGQPVADPFFYQWAPAQHASRYTVQMSSSASFSSFASCDTVNTTLTPSWTGTAKACMPTPGQLTYWRVLAHDDGPGGSSGPQSQLISASIASFVYYPVVHSAQPERNGLVSLDGPASGSSVSVPTLTWEPLAGSAKYEVSITDTSVSSATTTKKTTAATAYTPRTALVVGHTYRWDVRAISDSNVVGVGRLPQDQPTFTVSAGAAGASSPASLQASGDGYRFPSLSWAPASGASSYTVRLRPTGTSSWYTLPDTFAYPAGDDTGTTWTARPGDYDWQVDATVGGSVISSTETGTFTIDRMPGVRDRGVVGYRAALTGTDLAGGPACVADQTDGCKDLRQTPVLSWQPYPDAGAYRVYLSHDAQLTNLLPAYPTMTTSTVWTPPTALPDSQAGDAYYVVVVPCVTSSTCPAPILPASDQQSVVATTVDLAGQFNKNSNPVELVGVSAPTATVPSPAGDLDHKTTVDVEDNVALTWTDYLETNAGQDLAAPGAVTTEARSYRVQTATDAGFTKLLDDVRVDQTTFTSTSTTYPNGQIYWRVCAYDGSGNQLPWSAKLPSGNPASFDKGAEPPTPAAPAVGPVPADATLAWQPTDHTASYNVRIYRNDGTPYSSANSAASGTSPQASYTASKPLPYVAPPANGSAYLWQVQRVDARSRTSNWSAPQGFTVAADRFDLRGPSDGASLGPTGALFTWPVATGAATYRFERRAVGATSLTERPITPALAYAPTSLAPGSWEWRVVPVDSAGHDLIASGWRRFAYQTTLVAPTVTVDGTPAVGSTLTARIPTWSPSADSTTWQWMRGSQPIVDATRQDYTLTADDYRQSITVVATGHRSDYDDGTAKSAAVGVGLGTPPRLIGSVGLEGTDVNGNAPVGSTLTAAALTWDQPGVVPAYTWQRDGTNIANARLSSYQVQPADFGHDIRLEVVGALANHTNSLPYESAPVTVVAGGAIVPTAAPALSGTAALGQRLSVSPGTWTHGGRASAYQWLRDGRPITGADRSIYTVALSDIGHRLSARVTATVTGSGYAPGTTTTGYVTVPRVRSSTSERLAASTIHRRAHAKIAVTVTAAGISQPTGRVSVYDGARRLVTVSLTASRYGRVTVRLPLLKRGAHRIGVRYSGSATTGASRSAVARLRVIR